MDFIKLTFQFYISITLTTLIMHQIDIKISSQKSLYSIIFKQGGLNQIQSLFNFTKYTQICLVTDEKIAPLWLDQLCSQFNQKLYTLILPSGESQKNLKTVELCWKYLTEKQFDRKSLLIALGGGVIGDIVGFVASTYMRGIDFIQIPTTIIAQSDSSIGGKTGFDFLNQKNHIGTFYQPKMVLIDINTLSTLPKRELVQGFAEIIKHGLIFDQELFEFFVREDIDKITPSQLEKILITSCRIKKEIVEQDEKETTGMRKLLNFGHTFGHAVESLSWQVGVNLLHGEAIAIGMLAESFLSFKLGWLSQKELELIKKAIINTGLPADLSLFKNKIDQKNLVEKLNYLISIDKKNVGKAINWTLLKRIGEGVFDVKIDNLNIREILDYLDF